MRKHRLRVYRKDPDSVKPLPDIHLPQDLNTDSEIRSVIVISNENGYEDNKINKINLNDNLNYENKPKNYLIP